MNVEWVSVVWKELVVAWREKGVCFDDPCQLDYAPLVFFGVRGGLRCCHLLTQSLMIYPEFGPESNAFPLVGSFVQSSRIKAGTARLRGVVAVVPSLSTQYTFHVMGKLTGTKGQQSLEIGISQHIPSVCWAVRWHLYRDRVCLSWWTWTGFGWEAQAGEHIFVSQADGVESQSNSGG